MVSLCMCPTSTATLFRTAGELTPAGITGVMFLSIRSSTVAIISMIGITAIVLSLLAGGYFKQAALDAQMNSLSRVIEVASQEMLKKVRNRTFDLGMKLGHNTELISSVKALSRDEIVVNRNACEEMVGSINQELRIRRVMN